MPTPDAGAGSTTEPSATPFEQDVGEFFGDYSGGGETPEPESTSAAGTTPAEPATGTEPGTADATAAAGDATALTPPSDGTTPDAAAAAVTDDADPFAETTPATFMVNGQPFTSEDIRVFKEGGAVIRPEALQNVLNKLSERESLQERNHRQSQEYQTLAKAVEWTDPATNKALTGTEAAIEMRIGNAGLFAENQLLVETLTDPAKLASILTTELVPDGKGQMVERVIVSPQALQDLQTRNELRQLKATQAIREHYKGVMASAAKAPAPVNYETEAPKLVAALAESQKLDASVLTPQDKALLAKQLPFHVKNGQASLEWQELVIDRIKDRTAAKASAQSLVSSTEKATRDGQARMAAAARGVRPAVKPAAPAAPAKTPTPAAERASAESDLFDSMLSSGAAALRSSR